MSFLLLLVLPWVFFKKYFPNLRSWLPFYVKILDIDIFLSHNYIYIYNLFGIDFAWNTGL